MKVKNNTHFQRKATRNPTGQEERADGTNSTN